VSAYRFLSLGDRRISTLYRLRQVSRPDRETFGFMNSRIMANKSSEGKSRVVRSVTTTVSCEGLNAV
jgi:hypothetical protein